MKTTRAFCLLVAIAGCTVGDEPDADDLPTREEFVDRFVNVMHDEDGGEILTYDGDQPLESWADVDLLYDAYVEAHTEGEVTSELAVGRLLYGLDAWSRSQRWNLTYCVSNTFGTRKAAVINAMNQATAAWEATAGIDFRHVTGHDSNCNASNPLVTFNVSPINENNGVYASAFFPSWDRADRQVVINLKNAFSGDFGLAGILRHELGHTLGFRHETTRIDAWIAYGKHCFEDIWFRELTSFDTKSIMTTPACMGDRFENTSLTLSPRDKYGAGLLYPL